MFSKNNVLLVGALLSGIFASLLTVLLFNACGEEGRLCKGVFAFVAPLTFMFPLVLVVSLATYFLREEIFKAWISFAKWFVPLSIVLTILIPEDTGSAFVPSFGRAYVAVGMSILFLIISLTIIIWKSWVSRPKKI